MSLSGIRIIGHRFTVCNLINTAQRKKCVVSTAHTTRKDFTHSGSTAEKEEVFKETLNFIFFSSLHFESRNFLPFGRVTKQGSGLNFGVYVKLCNSETYEVSLFSFACAE